MTKWNFECFVRLDSRHQVYYTNKVHLDLGPVCPLTSHLFNFFLWWRHLPTRQVLMSCWKKCFLPIDKKKEKLHILEVIIIFSLFDRKHIHHLISMKNKKLFWLITHHNWTPNVFDLQIKRIQSKSLKIFSFHLWCTFLYLCTHSWWCACRCAVQ